MEEISDKALKPIVLKTSLGFDYFDYVEKLGIKTRQVYMKKDLIVPLSNPCLKKIRQMSEMKRHKI